MIVPLLLVLLLLPVIELALLIWLYRATDLLTTLGVLIGAGIVGVALAKWQGFQIWQRIRSQLSQGKTPTREVWDSLLIFMAGFLFILPGLFSDIVGLLLLLPPVRGLLRLWLASRIAPSAAARFYQFPTGTSSTARGRNTNEIEAEYTVEPSDHSSNPRLPRSADE